MRTAPFLLLACAILAVPHCSAQQLQDKLQGKWSAGKDSTSIILIQDSTWTFSSPERTSTYAATTREWVVDIAEPKPVVHDEVILSGSSDTITIVIDCACGDELYLSGGAYPKGAVFRRID